MRSISSTIGRLSAFKSDAVRPQAGVATKLAALRDFGSNPGSLGAYYYVPGAASEPMPLVVILHGCTQTAAGYDRCSGWSQLADRHGFALLFPEQHRANNMNLCFNWYEPGDSRRDAGEPLSIRQMIATMMARHDVDAERVYVTGLSAGGAMTSVMLATYPEMFAGGAIIAGLPFGSAASVPQALDRMRGHGSPDEQTLASAIRDASDHHGPWPKVSVWHGTADHVVDATNADRIVEQWLAIQGLDAASGSSDHVDGYPRRRWTDSDNLVRVEDYRITGMGHGTPLDTRGAHGCGASGAYMLDVAISSTRHIAQGWGLTGEGVVPTAAIPVMAVTAPPSANDPLPRHPPATNGVGKIIEDALRAAGLMK